VRASLKGFKKIPFLNTIKYILVLSTVPSVKRGVAIFLVPGPKCVTNAVLPKAIPHRFQIGAVTIKVWR